MFQFMYLFCPQSCEIFDTSQIKNLSRQETETTSLSFVAQHERETLYVVQRIALLAKMLPKYFFFFLLLEIHVFPKRASISSYPEIRKCCGDI
jgi:hypothetical protein